MTVDFFARIPGKCIGAALNTLAKPETATDETTEAVIDVPGIGTVRITAERSKHRSGRGISYFWTARHANIVGAG